MKVIKEILFWTWCLPQTLLGLVLKLIYRAKLLKYYPYCGIYYSPKMQGAISLGKYIIAGGEETPKTLLHELGHRKQSFILGPLYLLVIGLPSLIWCNILQKGINKKRIKKGKKPLSYYWFYTESWANKLVGIK